MNKIAPNEKIKMVRCMFFKLKEVREDHDLTQNDIGKLLSISRQNYSRWETGEKIIPLKHLDTLSNYYQISFDYLCGLSKENNYKKSNISKEKIGNRLKEFRKEKNITQKELATVLNTTHSTISAYESGKTTLLTIFAYEIAKKYNISMDWICGK